MQHAIYALIICLFLVPFSNSFAQHVHPHYQDGHIYLKLKEHSHLRIPDVKTLRESEDLAAMAKLIDAYGITDIKLAFPELHTAVFNRTYEISFSNIQNVGALMESLEALSEVEYAERVPLHFIEYVANDPGQNQQYALNLIQAQQAWDLHQGGNATVAIIDNAVLLSHQDLSPNIWVNPGETPNDGIDNDNNGYVDDINGYDVADNDDDPNPPNGSFNHGTHCAGIAAAATDNNTGIASIGFDTKIIAVKATGDSESNATISAGFSGISYAIAAGADVISMSWGGPGFSQTGQNLVNQAANQGIVMVAAAGNSNTNTQYYPAAYNNVISVASSTQNDTRSSFSNYGNWVDITAPGSGIFSTLAGSNSQYGSQSGTSMACPMVAGLCALMKSYVPSATPSVIENCLTSGADNIDSQNPNFVGQLGAGRINAFQAILCMDPNVPPVAKFTQNKTSGCTGFVVNFTDQSLGNPTSWSWSFPGGTPATSSAQNPTVTYNAPGTYDVSLTVTNPFGNNSLTLSGLVSVFNGSQPLPFTEDFESGSFATQGWSVENPDLGQSWEIATVSGTSPGIHAARMRFFTYNGNGQRDGLRTPPLDFGGLVDAQLSFEHAYRRVNTNNSDSLIIYLSTDCGNSFPHKIFAAAENGTGSLATAFTAQQEFAPSQTSEWCLGTVGADCFTVDLTPYVGNSNVVIKFEGYNNFQNNLYIDNINITGTGGNQPPVANFGASTTLGCGPLNIQFSDSSQFGPTNWSWQFPGGNPATSTQQNPSVVYANPGIYDVSLTVSNANGNNTQTFTDYIEVLSCAPSTCDTLDNFNNGSPIIYTSSNGGYVSGHNGFQDMAKAEFFSNTNNNSYLTGLLVHFGVAEEGSPGALLTCNIWDDDGTNGSPGTVLATINIPIAEIANDVQNNTYTFVDFGGVQINGAFFAGIELDYTSGDTVSLVTNTDPETNPATAWEQFNNGSWLPYDSPNSWQLAIAHDMIAFTSDTLPTADFVSTPVQVCEGNTVQFANTSLNGSNFQWIFPGGTPATSTDANPVVRYDTTGSWDVGLIVFGECLGYDAKIVTGMVTVGTNPSVSITQTTDEACGQMNGTAVAQAIGGGGAYSYSWNTSPVQMGATATGLSFGNFTVTVTDGNGCTATATANIASIPGPSLQIDNFESETCGLADGSATASASGGTQPYSFSWDTNPAQNSATASNLASGTYTVMVSDGNGCTDSATITITGTPAVLVDVTGGDNPCLNDAFATATPSGGTPPFDYNWNTSPPQTTQDISGLVSGTYVVTLTDAAGCMAMDSISLTDIGQGPTVDLGQDIESCDPVNLDVGNQMGNTILWSTGATTQVVSVDSSGIYSVTVTDGNGCSEADSISVTISQIPQADFFFSSPNNDLNYQFTNNTQPNDPSVSYVWDFGDGSPTSTDANPTHQFSGGGPFTITLVATNLCGSDTFIVTFTDVEPLLFDKISIYPNPASEILVLELEDASSRQVEIQFTNLVGQHLWIERRILEHGMLKESWSLSDLPAGLYLFEVIGKEKRIVERVLIRR